MKKIHRVIKFNQNAWLKPYIDMSTDLWKTAKNDFGKDFFKLMNNAVFGKTMENVRKHTDIKLATAEIRKNYLVSEPNYYPTKVFTENLLAIEKRKTQIFMSEPVYWEFSILELSKKLRYEFWYDYVKPKYFEKGNFCYMDTDIFSFIAYIKTDDIYKVIAGDVETRFDTSNDELDKALSEEKNWKSNWIDERWIRWKIMKIFCGIKSKNMQLLTRWQ